MIKNSPAQTAQRLVERLYLATELDQLHLDLKFLHDLIEKDELSLVLSQAAKTVTEKKHFLEMLIKQLRNEQFRKFLTKRLTTEGLSYFTEKHFVQLVKALQKTVQQTNIVSLTVPIIFQAKDLAAMGQSASHKLKSPTVLNLKVDPSLIGGAIVQYQKTTFDNSLKSKLHQLKTDWQLRSSLENQPNLGYKKRVSLTSNNLKSWS